MTLVAACDQSERTAPPIDVPSNELPASKAPSDDTSQWFARSDPAGPWAGYGPPASEAAFSARCADGRLIFNTIEMPPSGPGQTQMRMTFGGSTETLQATASEDGLPNTDAAVPADAPWLDRLMEQSGNLIVRVGGSDPMSVPISDPLRSLIRDCRG